MNRTIILLLLFVQAATGCSTFMKPKPVVHRRYSAYTRVKQDTPNVSLTVFAVPVPQSPAAETAITSFAGDAQAEMVKAMASRTANGGPHGLVQALAMPIRRTSSAPSFRDLTRISRRLVFSLDNESPGPANRISEARIFVEPRNGVRFVSWNRMENDHQTVELGRLSMSQERSTSAEVGLTLPVLSATPSVSTSAGNTLQEEILLRQQRTALTGALLPHRAMLLQQGGTGIDLTGNVTADFELVVPHFRHKTVFLASLPDACESLPSFDRQTIRYVTPTRRDSLLDTIRVDVQLNYLLRDVLRGHETTMEGDDSVVFRVGSYRVDSVAVLPAEALRFSVYELRLRGETVFIRGATASGTEKKTDPLQFVTFEDATAMLAWVRRCNMKGVSFSLLHQNRSVTPNDWREMHVWRTPVNYRESEDNSARH